jgi:hypothetical protein
MPPHSTMLRYAELSWDLLQTRQLLSGGETACQRAKCRFDPFPWR